MEYLLDYLDPPNSIGAQAYVDRNPGLKARRSEEYEIYKNGFK